MNIQTRSSSNEIASFDAYMFFSASLPRAWCQLADSGVVLLAVTSEGQTTIAKPLTLVYQSLNRRITGANPCGTLLASDWGGDLLAIALIPGPNCFHI
jgi:hypothetical protein